MGVEGRKVYRVTLSDEERKALQEIQRGKGAAQERLRARILLLADEDREDGGLTDAAIASALNVGLRTVERVRRRCVMEGVEAAVERRGQSNRKPRKLDSQTETKLVALACSKPPEGYARWSIRLLQNRVVELEIVDNIGRETVRRSLKQDPRHWRTKCWCIPPKANAEFVCAMEDVLETYHRAFTEEEVLVCLDETSKHTKEARQPIPAREGRPVRDDFEVERNGVANLFMVFAPLLGFRLVEITHRRTRTDWALLIRKLVDEVFPGKTLVLVMEDLNSHSLTSLYEAFPPEEARRIEERLEIHFTPKHGSWLNLAEIELSVLSRQCLDRRIPDRETLHGEVGAWQDGRNRTGVGADWRLKTADARIHLKSLYPPVR